MFIFQLKKIAILALCYGVLFFNFEDLFSQNKDDYSNYYNSFDSIVGIGNTGLYNGIEYEPQFNIWQNKHQFFKSTDFSIGNVVYDGQPYYNVLMKYDLWNDHVIVKLPTLFNFHFIRLLGEKVEEFFVHGNDFVNTAHENSSILIGDLGFVEVLFQGIHITGIKKYIKIKKEEIDKKIYNYFEESNKHYIVYKGKAYEVESKEDFLKIIPEHKKEIKSLFKKVRLNRKSNYDNYLIYMARSIDEFLQIETTSE